jgi:hypothetical protein
LPVAASYLAYYIWQPAGRKNYGELVKQVEINLDGPSLDGQPWNADSLKGKWVMVYVGSGVCPKNCEDLLYFMRQTRTAQGKEMDRIERLWVLTDDIVPAVSLQQAHAGLRYLRATQSPESLFAGGMQGTYLFMVDPLGHLMMRWPQNPDPRRMIKDIKHLLKASQIG